MTTKTDFTRDEWITLRALMQAAFFNMAVADRLLYDEEAEVWGRLRPYTVPFVQELIQHSDDPEEDDAVLNKAVHTELALLIETAREILQTKATPEEMDNFSRTLQALAHAVAEADGNVADQEAAFLAELWLHFEDWDEQA